MGWDCSLHRDFPRPFWTATKKNVAPRSVIRPVLRSWPSSRW